MNRLDLEWNAPDAENFQKALHLLNELISVLNDRLQASPDIPDNSQLRIQRDHYVQERRDLAVVDRHQVRRILADYPAVLTQATAAPERHRET